MDQYSREFIAEKARLRPEDLGLVRTARRSHNQLGLAYQIAFIRLTGRAPGQQPFEILEDLVGYVATELNANPRDLDLYARRGLLKGEQLHALARCVHYGRLGRLDQRDFERQTGAASCLLLILAAIIYWQIREIDRVLSEAGSDADDLNFELLSHISPIGWDNVLLYGEYQLNRSLVRSERLSVSMIDKPPLPSVPEESRAGRRRGKR
jgi:hypothetical protein